MRGCDINIFALAAILAAAPVCVAFGGRSEAKNLPAECNSETQECDCPTDDEAGDDCIKVHLSLGRTTPWSGSMPCALKVFADDMSPSVFTPDSLYAVMGYTFKRIGNRVLPDGKTPAEVVFSHPNGEPVHFIFKEGESVGYPDPGIHVKMDERLQMTDAEGWATASDPVYYDLYEGDGTVRRFLATDATGERGKMIHVRNSRGRTSSAEDMGIDIIYGADGVRQFLSPSRLADVAARTDGYDVAVYPLQSVPRKDAATGLYVPPPVPAVKRLSVRRSNGDRRATVSIRSGDSEPRIYVFDYIRNDWSLTRPSGVQERKDRTITDTKAARVVKEVLSPSGEMLSRKEMNYKWERWGFAMTNRIEGFGGVADTTEWTYVKTGNGKGRIATERRQSGLVATYGYDALDRKVTELKRAPGTMDEFVSYSYAPVDPSDVAPPVDSRPRTVVKTIGGIECERTYFVYSALADIVERAGTQGASYGGTNVLRTVTEYWPVADGDVRSGLVKSVRKEDGRLEVFDYALSSNLWTETVTHLHELSPSPVNGMTTRGITVSNGRGETVEKRTEAYVDGAWRIIGRDLFSYNPEGRLVRKENLAGQVTVTEWNCCRKTSETQPDGTVTTYDYDDDGRLVSTSRLIPLDMTNVTWLTTCYEYDGLGRQIATWQTNFSARVGTGVERILYDALGRVVLRYDKNGIPLRTVYSENGLQATVIFPDGATRTIESDVYNNILHITGSAGMNEHHAMSVLGNGCRKVQLSIGASDGRTCGYVIKNMLGKKIQIVRPGFSNSQLLTCLDYDLYGRIVRQSRHFITNGVREALDAEMYCEDAVFGCKTICKDRNLDGVVDFDGEDFITEECWSFILTNGVVISQKGRYSWPLQGCDRRILDALEVRHYNTMDTWSVIETFDSLYNITRTMTTYSVEDAREYVSTFCQSSSVPSVVCKKYGVVVSESSFSCVTNFLAYDFLGREKVRRDGNGIELKSCVYDEWGRISVLIDKHGKRTEFFYDNRGRVERRVSHVDEETFLYNMRGNLVQRSLGGFHQEFEYDEYGRQTLMRTFRNPIEDGDETHWEYDDGTGLLVGVSYDDDSRVNYGYSPDGRLLFRRWARGVDTVYSYDSAMRLENISYSDETPSVSFQYDRRDNLVGHTIAGGSACSYAISETGVVTNESQNGVSILRRYDTLGRLANMSVSNDFEITYGYDDFGRITFVGDDDIVMTLERTSGSDSICSRATGCVSQNIIYDGVNANIFAMTNYVDSTIRSSVQYSYDQNVRKSSALWGRMLGGELLQNLYCFEYDSRSFLSSIERSSLVGDQLPERFLLDYDGNGNVSRFMLESNGQRYATSTFVHNNLNQISECVQSNVSGIVDSSVFSYDLDGNIISDGRLIYSWNGENRLTSISCDKEGFLIMYAYDGLGRMVSESYTNSVTGDACQRNILWDGYNLLCISQMHNGIGSRQYFAYGPDIEGGLHGTAGVGGLAYMRVGDNVYIPVCDEFGNVISCFDRSGETVAELMYNGFVPLYIMMTNNVNDVIPTFNTMRYDYRSELLHYTFRSFSTKWNVWLNRDPCGEIGFSLVPGRPSEMPTHENLYLFKGNSPVSSYDRFGLDNPGCDVVWIIPLFSGSCPLECCAKHDECFDQNECTVWSWMHSLIPFTCDTPCDGCNKNVSRCMFNCFLNLNDPVEPDPEGRYYCAKLHKRVKDKDECK